MKDAPAKRGRGRATKLTPEVQSLICNEVVMGATYTDAAVLAGINVATFHIWKAKGEMQRRGIYRDFLNALSAARTKRRKWFRADILAKGKEKKDWRAVAYVASVTEPEQFAQKVHVVVEAELSSALERLKREFANEPATLQRALGAIAGESGAEATEAASSGGGPVAEVVGEGTTGVRVATEDAGVELDAARLHLAAKLAADGQPPED